MGVVQSKTQSCPRCGENSKLRTRDFSNQALATLISWGELSEKNVTEPICDTCYSEMRDALIEHQGKEVTLKAQKIKKVS